MNLKYFLFCFFIICFGRISAQEVAGIVINEVSGRPVKNAVLETPSEVVSTDDQGQFSFLPQSFPVVLKISARGFEEKSVTIENPDQDLVITLFPLFESLSEVILRSTIIPKELLKTPASVSLLSEEELQRHDETNIVENLSKVSGLTAHQGALNTNKISIRGIGARSQYSTNRVKAYFMEIPISSGEGATTLDDIDPSVVGRAEIIKGPVSSVYGAGLGGVINLYPAQPDHLGAKARVKSAFGSFGLLKNTAQASFASEESYLTATYNNLQSDGFRENSSYERNSFTLNGQFETAEENTLSFLGQFTRLKAFIPSSLNLDALTNNPEAAAYTWGAAKGYESYDKGLFGISYNHQFAEDFYNVSSVYMNFKNAYEPRPFDILKEEQMATGGRTKFNWQTSIFSRASEMSFGAEFFHEWYDSATFQNLYEDFPGQGSVLGNILSNNEQNRSYYNIFYQLNMILAEKLTFEAGLNLNSTRYDLTDLYAADEIDQSGDYTFETILSPRLGLVYEISTGKNLYASISHGFSTPSVAETLTPEGLINTSLKPETGVNYELGFKGNFLENRLYAEVAAFSIQVENLLVAERVAEDQYIGRNAGKTDHNGLEFLLSYNQQLSSSLTAEAFVNGSLNAFEFDQFTADGVNYAGNELPAVPQKSFNGGLEIESTSGISFFAGYQYQGSMPLDDENSLYTESYDLINFRSSYSPKIFGELETEVFAGVNNLLDEKYAASVIPNAVGFGGSAPRYFYPGNPRNYFAGISLSYLF